MISAIIPARNEPYLSQTIRSLLDNAQGPLEVIVILDGYWPDPSLLDDPRLVVVHKTKSGGMRSGINDAAALARGEFLLKADAHCMFAPGYDKVLTDNYQPKSVMVPRRYRLDPKEWKIIEDGRPPIDYMYLDSTLHGVEWREKNSNPDLKGVEVDDLMSSQGSCWFMAKEYFNELELLDAVNYGTFWNEFQEIGLKAWLSGGRVLINKKTWYAHWHKDKESGRGYSLPSAEQLKGMEQTKKWLEYQKAWDKQTLTLDWLFNKFNPPGWKQ